ncbi:hypothetical protein [Acinetobacter ursingii]|uniref:hypothetical protein n=1 Tax=Acinetobacter ursingii TaxID=108980 RepID=UPI00313F28D0
MNTLTQTMIANLESVDFISNKQAAELATQALKDYSKRSKAAKAVIQAVYDMSLAGGCPNAVFNRVESLVAHYSK